MSDDLSENGPTGPDAGGFEEDAAAPRAEDALVVSLDGFEGPIDLLLTLAREQKVDLTKISILQLADQYLAFIARRGRCAWSSRPTTW